MGLWMVWEVTGIASAGEDVRDTEGAVKAFDLPMEHIRAHAGLSAFRQQMLVESAREMRRQMLTEGRAAVRDGLPWCAALGDVTVMLQPRK
ncbi:hypothetical protein [Streptomyces lavendulocolor]|uniref:hypothetical protein n=1 Tax=Streptomyces lavendulocolor TaxID=67316 RepID=UPI003C2E4A03